MSRTGNPYDVAGMRQSTQHLPTTLKLDDQSAFVRVIVCIVYRCPTSYSSSGGGGVRRIRMNLCLRNLFNCNIYSEINPEIPVDCIHPNLPFLKSEDGRGHLYVRYVVSCFNITFCTSVKMFTKNT